MPWDKRNPDLTNDPSYLEPRISELEEKNFSGDYEDLTNKPDFSHYKKILLEGTANFNGVTGVVISHDIGHTNYHVPNPIPLENPNGYLGEVWVEKSMYSFKVCCSGSALTLFEYEVLGGE